MKHKSLDSLLLENFAKNLTNIWEDSMLEFVQGGNGPGDGMDFIRALANAWFNQDLSAIADQVKQDTNPKKKNMMDRVIDAQQAVEKILGRGVHCPDGKVRKYYIDYNSEFSGVEVQSHDHYEHTDYDDAGNEIDSRTGKPWSPYDLIKFDDDDLYEDWNKVNHHDKTNGLSQKAVNAYRREHPGSKLKTAVTTKPSKLKPGSKAAKRRKSFCARMSGNKGPMKKPNGKPTPKALALRRWNCESIEEMAQMILEGEQMIAEIKKGQKDSNGFTKCWPGKHAEGTKKGKNGGQVRNCVPNEGVAEGFPQPGPSSGAPKQFGSDAKIQTRQMTVKDIISSVPGVPYYNNVVDDWDAKDYSWGVTKKVIEYATYLKDHPESLAKLPPAIVLNGKFEDGAHRVSAIWLLQQRMDPKNPLWKNAKLNVQFVKQGVAEAGVDPNAPFDYDAWAKSGKKPRQPGKAVKQLAQQTRDAQKKKQQGVAEGKRRDGE